ncbi:hypothetical protein PHYC_03652 [Phycisphaerales bacterium]|nr:hypothetical protein PHYC_03652 [Phycisphaerales bacterium]
MNARRLALCAALLAPALLARPLLAQVKPESRAPKGAEVDLRPRFTKGQDVRLKMTLESRNASTAENADENSSAKQEIGLLLKCTSADPEKGYTLDMVYESLKASIHSGLADVDFDSTKPPSPDDPYDQFLRSLVGMKQEILMDRNGEITSVGGGDALGGLGGALAGQFQAADVFKSVFGPISSPKKSVPKPSVGESWTTETIMHGAVGTMRIEMTHTLASSIGGKATINSVGKVTLEPSAAGGKIPQVRISDSNIGGKTIWDLEAGMLNESEMLQRLTIQTRRDNKTESTTQEMNTKVVRVK